MAIETELTYWDRKGGRYETGAEATLKIVRSTVDPVVLIWNGERLLYSFSPDTVDEAIALARAILSQTEEV